LFIYSDRFRTAINVFGDSIGCAIVQHLSRKELSALDEKEAAEAEANTILPLLAPNAEQDTKVPTHIHSSNHVVPIVYDNPTFTNQLETINDDEDNTTARTNL
jgi:hypothetical protein